MAKYLINYMYITIRRQCLAKTRVDFIARDFWVNPICLGWGEGGGGVYTKRKRRN